VCGCVRTRRRVGHKRRTQRVKKVTVRRWVKVFVGWGAVKTRRKKKKVEKGEGKNLGRKRQPNAGSRRKTIYREGGQITRCGEYGKRTAQQEEKKIAKKALEGPGLQGRKENGEKPRVGKRRRTIEKGKAIGVKRGGKYKPKGKLRTSQLGGLEAKRKKKISLTGKRCARTGPGSSARGLVRGLRGVKLFVQTDKEIERREVQPKSGKS